MQVVASVHEIEHRIEIIEKKTEKTWYTARATESIRRGEGGLLSIYQVQSGDEAIHLYPVTPRPAGILFRPNWWTKHQYSSTPYIYTGLPQSHAAIDTTVRRNSLANKYTRGFV